MSFFKNYTHDITPHYNSREERNMFFADFVKNKLAASKGKILNIGSGGQRFLAKRLPDAAMFDIDIQGDADLLVNLETVEKLDFADNHFDVSCALDLLEHIDNFHAILDEMIRVTSKHIVISLPNPQNTFTELLLGRTSDKAGRDPQQCGVYSKFYGLPLDRPDDRHKWHYTIDDVIRLFSHIQDKHGNLEVTYFSTHRWNLKKRIVSLLLPNRIYYNLFLPNIWIWIKKG